MNERKLEIGQYWKHPLGDTIHIEDALDLEELNEEGLIPDSYELCVLIPIETEYTEALRNVDSILYWEARGGAKERAHDDIPELEELRLKLRKLYTLLGGN